MEAKIWNHSYWINETAPEILKESYEKKLIESGFSIVGFIDFHFKPQGYTAMFILAESHLAIHTFPEHNKSYIELSSCSLDKYVSYLTGNKLTPYKEHSRALKHNGTPTD